jgi:Fe-S-cluster containining protein
MCFDGLTLRIRLAEHGAWFAPLPSHTLRCWGFCPRSTISSDVLAIIMAIPNKVADVKLSDPDESVVSSSQSLCLRCGLCCDGTLFWGLPLKPDDDVTPLKRVNIDIVSDNDLTVLKLPCAAHKNCTCTVYANRPQACRTFKCKLLKSFERDDISQRSALEIINKMKSLKNEMNELALAASATAQSGKEILLLMKRYQTDPSIEATKQDYARVLLKFGELQIYLDRFFRDEAMFAPASPVRSPSAPRQDSTTGTVESMTDLRPTDAGLR